ncbi:SnoaL-like domain-containing protein [Fimbriimonas ginsengisoli]|uniref:SnoaL-like domain-containing protein n=1 Tax=Fimbriimonas ginsengisoli Gsoil 348 TaxID=661478 RepID=A0A068NRT3_FIMGI|nr:SnoaL-like domain-containing protein [Fimbriimonas ginsengisoli]AIE86136.1 hypothetical protein OP10G_2768 [Fimbriimonas ginsengisoli Gsoil 348]
MSVRSHVEELIGLVKQGALLDAFERFYAENVSMQENSYPASVGKDANREREKQFLASVKEVHEVDARFTIVEGNQAAIGWLLDFTNTDGVRLRMDQVAYQVWENGQIVSERFYYDTAGLAVKEEALV